METIAIMKRRRLNVNVKKSSVNINLRNCVLTCTKDKINYFSSILVIVGTGNDLTIRFSKIIGSCFFLILLLNEHVKLSYILLNLISYF